MAILAVSEGGLPACRKATRTASLPTTTLHLPNPTQRARVRRWRISKLPPAEEEVTTGCRRTKAGRTVRMVGDDVKQRSDKFSDT